MRQQDDKLQKTHYRFSFALMLPLTSWSEAPVVDDSENFAIMDGQQVAEALLSIPNMMNHNLIMAGLKVLRAESYANG